MKLFLFDGSALVHRSFHAFSNRSGLSTRGQEVGMVFGFLTTLLMVLRRERPDRLALAFDTGAPTFRHIRFEEYKATRGPLDEGIRSQLPILHDLLALLNIPQLSLDGYEADDIIGTLAVQGAAAGNDVFIVAGDKDFLQLVNDRIRVYRLPNSRVTDVPEIIDSVGVINRFGVPPERVIDVLGLMGDSVDNVPGVPKVGEKTALELVRRFGSLEGALERAAEVERPALRENLIAYADQARLSKELVIIETAVPLGVEPDALRIGPMHTAASRKRLIELEFHNLLRQIEALEPTLADEGLFQEEVSADNTTDEKPPANYRAVTSPGQFSEMIAALRGATLVSLDTETTAIDPMKAELVGLSFSIRPEEAWYVSVNHFTGVPEDYRPSTPAPTLRPRRSRELAYILEHLIPFFGDSGIAKTGQNLKYDTLVLKCYNIEVEGLAFDAMLASFVLDPSARQHGIDALAESHLNFRKIPTSDLIGSGTKQKSMLDVPLDAITRYACEDADIALRLTHHFQPRLKSESLDRLYYETELVLMPVLMRMEFTGLQIDTALLGQLSREFQVEMDERLAEVHDLAGMTFNLNSTQQLAQVLYERLGLPVGRKTKFGWSTDVEELERLAPLHPLPAKLLRYRHLTKLKSTYIDALPQMVHPITGRVHTSFSQTTAATGRLASTDPNLQNIPIRTDEGGRIRKAFVAGIPGWKIVSADYSQVELRIMAHLAGDERMIEAFRSGKDIHRATAAWMNGIPEDQVTSDMRRQAKEVNFGVLYGMGEFGLAQRLGISRATARAFIEQYFSNFSRVREYIDELHTEAREKGYVETILGRRRPLPDLRSENFNIRSNAERIAINTPIQGSAADLIKIAMIRIDGALRTEGFRARMLLQVHDELLFEAPADELEPLSVRLRELMSGAMNLTVPLEVGISWGDDWLAAHE